MLCNITPRSNFTLFLSIFLTIDWTISSILLCLLFMLSLVILGQLSPTEVQFSSVAQSCTTLCDPMDCSTPGFPVHHQLLEHTQTHVHRVGDAIQPSSSCRPCLLLPSIFPSIRVFSKDQFFTSGGQSFSISPSNEYSGLISFRIDWFDLLAVQGTLNLLPNTTVQKHLKCSAFSMV